MTRVMGRTTRMLAEVVEAARSAADVVLVVAHSEEDCRRLRRQVVETFEDAPLHKMVFRSASRAQAPLGFRIDRAFVDHAVAELRRS